MYGLYSRRDRRTWYATTIIETGLDIPNVNTIIIQDADRMGLSQLYQLRGRVGTLLTGQRMHFLCTERDKMLTGRRLKSVLRTIKEFTEPWKQDSRLPCVTLK